MSTCFSCGEEIIGKGVMSSLLNISGSQQIEYHPECMIRMTIGGLNHLKKLCTCCGGIEPPDPPELTKRQAAIAAVEYYNRDI